jgi:glutaconate CoA-transferase subunit B
VLVPQEKRRLVPEVRFRTSPGHGDGPAFRATVGLPPGGPTAIVTTHAVFRFDRALAEAYLYEVYPGVTVDHLLVAMSFTRGSPSPSG